MMYAYAYMISAAMKLPGAFYFALIARRRRSAYYGTRAGGHSDAIECDGRRPCVLTSDLPYDKLPLEDEEYRHESEKIQFPDGGNACFRWSPRIRTGIKLTAVLQLRAHLGLAQEARRARVVSRRQVWDLHSLGSLLSPRLGSANGRTRQGGLE